MSASRRNYLLLVSRSEELLALGKASGASLKSRQVVYHAAIAARVAAWDSYVKRVALEALTLSGDPLNGEVQAQKALAINALARFLEKFNTPNFDNSRNLFVSYIGWDPATSWEWQARAMTWQQVQQRLNEVLKVRHSFAHGHAIPTYTWVPNKAGDAYLKKETVQEVGALLTHLVNTTDAGLYQYMPLAFGTFNKTSW